MPSMIDPFGVRVAPGLADFRPSTRDRDSVLGISFSSLSLRSDVRCSPSPDDLTLTPEIEVQRTHANAGRAAWRHRGPREHLLPRR